MSKKDEKKNIYKPLFKRFTIYIIFTILLTSCSFFGKNNNDEVNKAKEELLGENVGSNSNEMDLTNSSDIEQNENIEETEVIINEPTAKITNLTSGDPLIEIEDLSNKDFYSGEFYINGKTLGKVDNIEVYFINNSSNYPADLYKLKQFKSGDLNFKYMASSNFKTLDFGLNEYVFTAYSGENTYKVKVEIDIPEKEIKNTTNTIESKNDNDNINVTSGENLKITSIDNASDITCDSQILTDYLVENYGYSYWNSCRDIVKDKSIGFYVLRLKGENYFYEKHYVDYEKQEYGVLLLEAGTGITKDMMKEKNDELKQVFFDKTIVTDNEFKN